MSVVSADNGHGGLGAGAAAARPVVLVRYRPGVVGETARTAHVVPLPALPTDGQVGVIGALCGAVVMLDHIETVTPGESMPCILCLLNQVMSTAPIGVPSADRLDSADAGLAGDGVYYRRWGWPVTLHGDQVRLSLHREVSALAIPVPLCIEVTEILARRQCAPAVLAHPYLPEYRIVLTGERFGVALAWPRQVHRVTGVVLLPPTVTPRGPITWAQPPREDSLRGCREIDLRGALRTALRDSTPSDNTPCELPQ